MTVGDYILSEQEETQLARDAMAQSLIVANARPLSGFRFENWRFVPDLTQKKSRP